jgi:hypothetical protein
MVHAASTGRANFHRRAMITEECRALIAAEFPFKETGRRLPNGKWQMPVDAETWKRLQKVRLHGESISDCIVRVIIITLHRRGLLLKKATLASQRPAPTIGHEANADFDLEIVPRRRRLSVQT